MTAHRIRLRGPWTLERVGDTLIQVRRFGAPVQIPPGERAWLVIDTLTPAGQVSLNGVVLGRGVAHLEEDITEWLQSRNELRVEQSAPCQLGEVFLEFRETLANTEVKRKGPG